MEKIRGIVSLLVFSAFCTGTLVPVSSCEKLFGNEATVEGANPASGESKEDPPKVKDKEFFSATADFVQNSFAQWRGMGHLHFFKLVENIYFEVPHSPPNLA